MGGLLGEPIGYKRRLTADDDLNNIKEQGRYAYGNSVIPTNGIGELVTLYVFVEKLRGDIIQFALSAGDGNLYIRIGRVSGSWTDWKIIFSLI